MNTRSTRWIRRLMGLLVVSVVVGASAQDVLLFPRNADRTQGSQLKDDKFLLWNKLGATSAWDVQVEKDDSYNLFFEMNCIGWARGSTFEFFMDDVSVGTYLVPNTSSSYQIEKLKLTTPLTLTPGTHKLLIKVISVKNSGLMGNTRLMLLTPRDQVNEMVDSSFYEKSDRFALTMKALRDAHPELGEPERLVSVYTKLWADFPYQMGWVVQDVVDAETARNNPKLNVLNKVAEFFEPNRDASMERTMINSVMSELSDKDIKSIQRTFNEIGNASPADARWLDLYETACRKRRSTRLAPLLAKTDKIVFAKHQVFGSSSGIYNITETEGLNKGETSELCTVDLTPEKQGDFAAVTPLFDAKGGMVRDPDISFDATKMLFAWRKDAYSIGTMGRAAPDSGNYQVYEMDLATQQIRALTTDETYGANYEAIYLPDGNILFNSARIVQHITCGWGDHSNLFLMDKDGKYQRRVGFDQVSTQFPTVLNNGQVIYLRRDYNDRAQSAAHALFVMNTDGTGQTEFYGNQTGTPNSFMHARAIPGSDKVACVLSGYHTRQGGQLALVDIRQGRNYGEGVVQIPQGTKPPHSDGYDDGYLKDQVQYANPFALSETEFIVSRSDQWCDNKTGGGTDEHYALYFMTADNRREVLAYDAHTSCLQAVPVMVRPRPAVRATQTDYTKQFGTYYVQDVKIGVASEGITNKVAKLRVIEILYKHDTIKSGTAYGPGGGQDTVTPPAHPLALFDAKRIIGDATVYEDGSAMFEVPVRVPVYFQLLDEKNRCLQTMRSWTTLMPNERFSCVGCHENKDETPVSSKRTIAMSKGIEKLKPFYGEPRGFSFMKEVQPIFDTHCVKCHTMNSDGEPKHGIVLTAEPFVDVPHYGRSFAQSYIQLMAARPGPNPQEFRVFNGPPSWNRSGPAMADEPNKYVQYWGRLRTMPLNAPYFAGSIVSGLTKLMDSGHKKVKLSQEEWDKLAAWIDLNCPYSGDYMEGNIWGVEGEARYKGRMAERKRNEAIEAESIAEFIKAGQ